MKRFTKFALAVCAMTMLFSVPVSATEKTLDAEIAMITNHINEVEDQVDYLTPKQAGFSDWNALNAHRRTVMKQTLGWAVAEFDNYILYLQKEEANAAELVRVKEQNIAAINDLCKVNPSFAGQLAQANAELLAAQQQVGTHQAEITLCKQYKENSIAAIKAKAATYK